MKISSNIVGDSNDENKFPDKLLLTNTQVSKFCKAFANNSSANIKLSKTQLHKIEHSGGFFGRILGPVRVNDDVYMYIYTVYFICAKNTTKNATRFGKMNVSPISWVWLSVSGLKKR